MITRRIFGLAIAAASGAGLLVRRAGAQTPATASKLLEAAEIEAAEGRRAILAIFHASW